MSLDHRNAARIPHLISQFLGEIQEAGFILRYVATGSALKPCDADYILSRAPDDVVLMLQRDTGAALA